VVAIAVASIAAIVAVAVITVIETAPTRGKRWRQALQWQERVNERAISGVVE
jgi:hypothetical protein